MIDPPAVNKYFRFRAAAASTLLLRNALRKKAGFQSRQKEAGFEKVRLMDGDVEDGLGRAFTGRPLFV